MAQPHEGILNSYNAIIDGYSPVKLLSGGTFLFKHPTQSEIVDIFNKTEEFVEDAVSQGIDKEEDQIKFIIEQGWWTKEQEAHLNANRTMIIQLSKTRQKMRYFSEKEHLSNQIKNHENIVEDLLKSRAEYIGLTAESWGNSKSIEYYIAKLAYNPDKSKIFATPEDFYDLEEKIVIEYKIGYYQHCNEISGHRIKQVAASAFFQNLFYIADESVMSFFGKPVISLTKYQSDLMLNGKWYRHILKNSQSKIPETIMEDPDKFIEWAEGNDRSRDVLEKRAGGKVRGETVGKGSNFLFGEKGDAEKMGVTTSGGSLLKETKEKGGLGLQDALNR
jgi:hypothetical protein